MRAEPPPQPTREDNRRIHEAIETRWADGRDCYLANFSDAKLAAELDVPRAWVTDVRERFFGPDTCEARLDGVAKLDELIDRAAALEERALSVAAEVEAVRREAEALRKAAAA